MARIKFLFKKEPIKHIKKRRKIILPTIAQIYWDITYKCPLKCRHCYAKPLRRLGPELTIKEVKKTLDYLKKHNINLITFTGGEPLLRKDIFEILKYSKNKGFHVSLITSGIYPELLKKIKESGVKRIQFSLDGSTAKLHDKIKRRKRAFEKTLESIKTAKGLGLRVSVNSVIIKENYEDIEKIFDLAKKLKVDEYRLMRLIPYGLGEKNYKKLAISPQKYAGLLKRLIEKYLKNKPILIHFEEPFSLYAQFKDSKYRKYIFYTGCLAGEAGCCLSADGKIMPCLVANYKEFIAGDIRKDDLLRVFKNSRIFRYFRETKNLEICNKCPHQKICGGGCRCAAFGYFHRITAPDPACKIY